MERDTSRTQTRTVDAVRPDWRDAVPSAAGCFRSVFDDAPIPMVMIGLDGRLVHANTAFCRLVGYSSTELAALTLTEITHPDDAAKDAILAQRLLAGEIARYTTDSRYIRKGQEPIGIKLTVQLIRDAHGNPQCKLGVALNDHDMTERKQAEAALRESEQRFRDLIEGSIQGIIIQRDRKPLFANQAFADIHGYRSVDEILAMRSVDSFLAPHEIARLRAYEAARLRGEEAPVYYRFDALRKDGTILTLQNIVRVVSWQGQPAVQSTVIDVTERKRALDALWDSERRLAEAQLIAHVGSWERTISTGELYWSDQVYRIFGVRPQEFEPTFDHFLSCVHPEDREFVRAAVLETLNRNKPYSLDHRIVRPDGVTRIVHEQAEIKLDASGRAVRIVGTVQDITERKQAEEVLRRYEQIVSASGDFVSFVDRHYIYRAVNNSYLQALGKSKEQFVGYSMAEVLGNEVFATLVKPNVDRCLAGEHVNYQYWYQFGQRGRRYLDAHYDPFRENDGSVSGVVVNIRDITNSKEAEDELRASRERLRNLAARLEAVREEERSAIAREIHDELGQALTGLKLDLAWLTERLPQEGELIGERLRAMFSLLDSTLDAVRRLSSRLRPALLDDLGLEAAVEWYMQDYAGRTNCKYTLRTNAGQLDINQDRDTALFRIFQEALTNIARHADASHVIVDLSSVDSQLLLTVSDDGCGISHEAIASTGSLGLIGMRERARAIGGHVRVQPRRTGGTRVEVVVPIAKPTEKKS